MGAFLGVNAGSAEPPKLIHLTYKPRGSKPKKRVALIGKGITFDSGGLNLKPTGSIETMKCDMSGSAAVLAAMSVLPELKPDVEGHGFMAMTENMPGGRALKPGDVITMKSGMTVEIGNTDAEGRLVMADGITHAIQNKADVVADIATLTGACMVALGDKAFGVMGNDQDVVDDVIQAADEAGERGWQLPLIPEYRKKLDSEIADIRNIGDRYGGAITAGLFLKEFAGKTPWVHIDIAGTAWLEEARPYMPKGPSGVAVRTLAELAFSADSWPK
jgi:leucyl aminopeptidase